MMLPQTWDWAESLADPTPEPAAARWVPQGVFANLSPSDLASDDPTPDFGEEESGEVEQSEWELAGPLQEEAFPSGLTLLPGSGATGRSAEHWDPNGVGLPLYATGPSVRPQRLATNFTVGELVSSGGQASDVARISPALVRCLQALRTRLGKPVVVSSGYRSWARNVAVYRARGRKPTASRHCSGQAADISVSGMSGLDLARAVLDAWGPDVALGIGTGYVHVDVRGTWARWSYASGAAAARDIAAIDAHRRAHGTRPALPAPGAPASGPHAPGAGTLRSRIVALALQECARWGNGARKETDPAMSATLQEYWRGGVERAVSTAEVGSSSWQQSNPWSAAFVSWVMVTAGAAFPASSAHREYVAAAKSSAEAGDTSAAFWAYPVTKVVPEVGDLVCADRAVSTTAPCGGVTYETVGNGTLWNTHCDIVTAVDRNARTLTMVGGNTSDSVSDDTIKLDAQGFVVADQRRCRFYAIVKLRETTSAREAEGDLLSEDEAVRAVRLNDSYTAGRPGPAALAAMARLVGAPDGGAVSGAPFVQAVARWQRARGLAADGVVGPTTFTEMRRELAAAPA